jgi:hypothetical protein
MTRPCNSERYFIGRDFRGSNADSILKSLLEIQECSAKAMYPILSKELLSEIPFLDKHIDSTTTLQVTAIKLAISLIHNPEDWWKNWYLKCLKKSSIWCETFRVPSIPDMNHMAATRLRFPDYFMH